MNIYLLVAWFILLIVAESFWGLRALREKKSERLIRNLAYFFLNTILNKFLYIYILIFAEKNSPLIPGEMYTYRTLVVVIFLDLMIYYWHRLNHSNSFLWKFHKLHHSDRDMDVSTALRFHFLEFFFSTIFRALLVFFLGIKIKEIIIFDSIVMFHVLFQHSNLKLGKGLNSFLGLVFVTPIHHHYHHSSDSAELRSHYGSIFSFWDKLHRTNMRKNKIEDVSIGLEEFKSTPSFFDGFKSGK